MLHVHFSTTARHTHTNLSVHPPYTRLMHGLCCLVRTLPAHSLRRAIGSLIYAYGVYDVGEFNEALKKRPRGERWPSSVGTLYWKFWTDLAAAIRAVTEAVIKKTVGRPAY